jgi:hypothetical protein
MTPFNLADMFDETTLQIGPDLASIYVDRYANDPEIVSFSEFCMRELMEYHVERVFVMGTRLLAIRFESPTWKSWYVLNH